VTSVSRDTGDGVAGRQPAGAPDAHNMRAARAMLIDGHVHELSVSLAHVIEYADAPAH
jgi:hypothetical protein